MSTVRFDARFPGYEVLSELGRSNARILKARHVATGDLVAIKHFALNTDAETLRRFQRESAIMTSIAHPNIVKVLEVRLEAELPYIVMELIEGGSLQQLITGQQRIDVSTTVRLGLQMARAFKAIHTEGIIHRDVKPENILFRPLPSGELHFLLTDFGVARLHEQSNTLTGQSLMTYEYASPEQFNDPRAVGVASDYYSLGVVLYQCLHGSVPFSLGEHTGIVTFMNKVLTEPPPALILEASKQPLISFTELLNSLLQKKAQDRLQDPDELIWQLKQAELNYLQADRSRPTGTSTSITRTIGDLKSPTPNVPNTEPPVVSSDSLQKKRPSKFSVPNRVVWLALGLLLGGVGLYYAFDKSGPISGLTDSLMTDNTSPSDMGAKDSMAIRKAKEEEALRHRQELRQQAAAAANSLSVKITNFRKGLVGGIRDVELQLRNPSSVTFASVTVQVNYYKGGGDLYNSERVYFGPVGPNSSLSRSAPDSKRGTRVSSSIVDYRFSRELDSLVANPEIDLPN